MQDARDAQPIGWLEKKALPQHWLIVLLQRGSSSKRGPVAAWAELSHNLFRADRPDIGLIRQAPHTPCIRGIEARPIHNHNQSVLLLLHHLQLLEDVTVWWEHRNCSVDDLDLALGED